MECSSRPECCAIRDFCNREIRLQQKPLRNFEPFAFEELRRGHAVSRQKDLIEPSARNPDPRCKLIDTRRRFAIDAINDVLTSERQEVGIPANCHYE